MTESQYFLFNIFQKKFLSKPLIDRVERFSGDRKKFPTYGTSYDNAIVFTLREPLGKGDFYTEMWMSKRYSKNRLIGVKSNNVPKPLGAKEAFILNYESTAVTGTPELLHNHLYVTGNPFSNSQGYQDEVEDGIVMKPSTVFFLSETLTPFATDLFNAHHRDTGPIRAFLPLALGNSITNTLLKFPLDLENLGNPDFESKIAGDYTEDYDFQWILVPKQMFGGELCTATEPTKFLRPMAPPKEYCIDDKGNAFFSTVGECRQYQDDIGTHTPIGWQCISRIAGIDNCISVTRFSFTKGQRLYSSAGDCLLECEPPDVVPAVNAKKENIDVIGDVSRDVSRDVSGDVSKHRKKAMDLPERKESLVENIFIYLVIPALVVLLLALFARRVFRKKSN